MNFDCSLTKLNVGFKANLLKVNEFLTGKVKATTPSSSCAIVNCTEKRIIISMIGVILILLYYCY